MGKDVFKSSKLQDIAEKFDINGSVKELFPVAGGLINTTYKVVTEPGNQEYILQNKNCNIFKDIPGMMDNILKVTAHIKEKIKNNGDSAMEAMQIVKSKSGLPYYKDEEGEFWTLSIFIPDTIQFEGPISPETARKGGEGIGKFHKQLSDFNLPLAETLPGFHDLKFRFRQWDETLKENRAGRIAQLKNEIDWVEKRRPEMEKFHSFIDSGELPKRVVHNDTKITNLLFNKDGSLRCVIDLDTVMQNTPLADFGDAIRTMANTGEEDDKDLSKVSLDIDIYKAYLEGYLSETKDVLTEKELEYLPFGPLYITYEQVMRFLMDYIDGDRYYKTDYDDHNLVRTRAQMKLYESMEQNYDKMKSQIST